ISQVMYEIIYVFFVARTLESAIKEFQKKFNFNKEECKEIIENLLENRIILEYEYENKKTSQIIDGMFGTSIIPLSDILSSSLTNIVFLGFPYDLSVTYKSGCKFAPNAIRKASTSIFNYKLENNNPIGSWSDIENRQILKNIFMADCGDINFTVGHRNGREFDYLREIVSKIIKKKKFPVIIGGDHSISLANILGATDVYNKIGIIHLDAHSDYGTDKIDEWQKNCHHGNFMNWVASNDKVEVIAQMGIRQLREKKICNKKFHIWPGRNAIYEMQNILETLPQDIPYYITFDIDSLDPSIIKSTGTPLPNGFLYNEVIDLLKFICSNLNIIGLDVVEYIPSEESEAAMISNIILTVIDYVSKEAIK
ncbi:TPA: arginase family protein, partial [Clostridium perfringens]